MFFFSENLDIKVIHLTILHQIMSISHDLDIERTLVNNFPYSLSP